MSGQQGSSTRLWIGAAAVVVVAGAARMTQVQGLTWPRFWAVSGGLVVLWGLWASRRGRRISRGSQERRRSGFASAGWEPVERVRAGASVARSAVLPRGSAGQAGFWLQRSRRNQGVASRWSMLRQCSGWAMRRRAGLLRPTLATLGWWQVSAADVGTAVARVGWLRVWSAVEDVTLRLGGPRTGKSGELAGRILDAAGAVLVTSTRTDLWELCGPILATDRAATRSHPAALAVAVVVGDGLVLLGAWWWLDVVIALVVLGVLSLSWRTRARAARPVLIFNPSGLGAVESTVRFDPLGGCGDPVTATRRAADLMAGCAPGSGRGGSDERKFWTDQGARALAALMHAAALDGRSMRDVQSWVANPEAAKPTVIRILRRSPAPTFMSDAEQFLTNNKNTQSSITTSIMPALGWLSDVTAYACTQPAEDGSRVELDVPELLASRAAVFLLGAEDASTAPLVTALTAHIAREARRIAALSPSGRLDPALTLVLDEAALICPVPLDNWTADMGGRNVTIHIGAQSRAQLRQRWGDSGAAAIMNNAATLLVYGGTRDPDDLNAYSLLSGERHERNDSVDGYARPVPVLSPAQIAQLPAKRVLIVRRGMAPMIGRVQMGWERRDVRTHQRATRRLTRRAHTAPAAPVGVEDVAAPVGPPAGQPQRVQTPEGQAS